MVRDALLARKVNLFLGGAAVMPWEVGQVPDEWMMVMLGMVDELPKYQKGRAEVENVVKAWREKAMRR
jgi:hypothetical protein